jgi:uncharacterized protein (DUF58 family)
VDATAALTPERVLRRLKWRVLRRLDGHLQGDYRTALRGHGTDYLDLRDYVDGDDVRHIDWNVTARTAEPFIREFTEDRELTAWLLLDRSASMTFGPDERTKERVLTEVAATFAQLLVRGGNRVGAILFDNHEQRTIRPRTGRDQVLILLRDLLRQTDTQGAVTDLSQLFDLAARTIRRRALVVIVSDFITGSAWERPLLRLSARHEVVAVRLLDRHEFSLPDAGLVIVQDAETGEQLLVDTSDPEFRRRLHAAGVERERAVRQTAARAGVELHTIATDDDLVAAFVRMVEWRRRRRR